DRAYRASAGQSTDSPARKANRSAENSRPKQRPRSATPSTRSKGSAHPESQHRHPRQKRWDHSSPRQPDDKTGASRPDTRLVRQRPLVTPQQRATDGEPETHSVHFAGHERLEELRDNVRRHAGP